MSMSYEAHLWERQRSPLDKPHDDDVLAVTSS